jgi:hypothetical protein
MAAENYSFIVCSFLGFVMTFFPFPWHRNGEHHQRYDHFVFSSPFTQHQTSAFAYTRAGLQHPA